MIDDGRLAWHEGDRGAAGTTRQVAGSLDDIRSRMPSASRIA